MRTPIVAGNWKMNLTVNESVDLTNHLVGDFHSLNGVDTIIFPPYLFLTKISEIVRNSNIRLGAQNLHPEPKGAFTGEISGQMLRGICKYVLIGHSERRHLFGETHGFIHAKMNGAIDSGLTPILCVGETLNEREANQAFPVIASQIETALADLELESLATLMIAYEPVWAIGTGQAATGGLAQEIMSFIRETLSSLVGSELAEKTPLLYGGSVTSENIVQFSSQKDINGALVGGASLNAADFLAIAKVIERSG